MSYPRTKEHRALSAELIRKWRPWEKSTGPRTEAGKAAVAQNAFKGGERQLLRELRREFAQQREVLDLF